jgi:ABC-type Na+ efflux pump permease subunit
MRWHILRTLLHKEVLRHLANRGGLVLVLLLVVASMLLSFFGNGEGPAAGLGSGVRLCYVDYCEEVPLIQHLRRNVPPDLTDHVKFRPLRQAPTDARGYIVYPQNTGAIQLRPANNPGAGYRVVLWYPGADGAALAPYEAWFWKESLRFVQAHVALTASPQADALAAAAPDQAKRSALRGGMDARSSIATSLVLFGLFFVCVYLLPSLTCEERERGTLLAQALSPASTTEILAAKFLFYPVVALALAAVLAGTHQPLVLTRPFFWVALVVAVCGTMGVGLTIASIARTQRAASMGAMCYMFAVALLLFICQQSGVPALPYLALEYHCPRILHAALTGAVQWYHYANLAAATALATAWATLAAVLFRRHGWQ